MDLRTVSLKIERSAKPGIGELAMNAARALVSFVSGANASDVGQRNCDVRFTNNL